MPSRSRRIAREWALKILYAIDVGKLTEADALAITEEEDLEPETFDFIHELVSGVLAHREELDRHIAALSRDWAVDRQPAVDRNLLRMAGFEILHCPHIPSVASINEAVELSKIFSTAESSRYINGVLGALLDSLSNGTRRRASADADT